MSAPQRKLSVALHASNLNGQGRGRDRRVNGPVAGSLPPESASERGCLKRVRWEVTEENAPCPPPCLHTHACTPHTYTPHTDTTLTRAHIHTPHTHIHTYMHAHMQTHICAHMRVDSHIALSLIYIPHAPLTCAYIHTREGACTHKHTNTPHMHMLLSTHMCTDTHITLTCHLEG